MNCSQAREHLPALLYGDLQTAEAAAVEGHLAHCAACRREYAELRSLRRTLDTAPVPSVQVDLPRLFAQAEALRVRQARRWRRAAAAFGALAATLLVVFVLRLEVRLEAHQVVVRWGAPAQEAEPSTPAPQPERVVIVQREPVSNPEIEARLQVMNDTLHALADYLDERDTKQRQLLERLQARIESAQRQNGQRWSDTERSVAAIYKAVFVLPREGGKQ
jgi:hypothetical protein